MNSPNSICLHSRDAPAPWPALWPPLDKSTSFLFWGLQSWLQDLRWGLTRAEQGGQSFPLPCCPWGTGCSPEHIWFLGCQSTLLGHVELLTHQHPQVLPRADLNPFFSQSMFELGIALISGAGPHNCPCWTSWDSHSLTSQAWPGLIVNKCSSLIMMQCCNICKKKKIV